MMLKTILKREGQDTILGKILMEIGAVDEDGVYQEHNPTDKIKKLPPEKKEEWLAALRSGRYSQVDGTLVGTARGEKSHRPSMCCLGVACDVFQEWTSEERALAAKLGGGGGLTMPYECPKHDLPITNVPSILQQGTTANILASINDKSKGFGPVIRFIEKYL